MGNEELRLMEIRVTLELPNSVFEEYSELKHKRKLTDHMQKVVNHYEDDRGNIGNTDTSSISRLEDAVANMTDVVATLIKSQENDRLNRDAEFERINNRISESERTMGSVFEKILERLDGVGSVQSVSDKVVEPVATTDVNAEMLKMMQMMASSMGTNAGVAVQAPIQIDEVKEDLPTAPSAKSKRKLASMMDI